MGLHLPAAATLIALSFPAMASAAPGVPGGWLSLSPAVRFEGGTSATLTVGARIIRASASVGPGRGPPAPHMRPRSRIVSAADGRAVPALVYDFE